MTKEIKVRKIHPDARIPAYAHHGDAGMDLFSIEEIIINPGESVLVKTGIQLELPTGTEAQIRPRSGLALKHSVTVLNTPGTIDQGYRGEIGVILINHGKEKFKVEKSMRIAQMVISTFLNVNVNCVDYLTATERAEGGFGSTGTK
ncbi:dUTP diphosphatase [Peribacillus simplex]|uniref:dUTP diphosphatase n=1 Tax=Peribacillus simplex TaxID=1478 RepID=UPI003D2CACB0